MEEKNCHPNFVDPSLDSAFGNQLFFKLKSFSRFPKAESSDGSTKLVLFARKDASGP